MIPRAYTVPRVYTPPPPLHSISNWRRCKPCAVLWEGLPGDTCWVCDGPSTPTQRPMIQSTGTLV